MSRAKLLRNYNVSDWKRNTIAEMHSRNLVGEKRNLCLARALNTSPAMQSCCHKYLDEFHVPSDRILNRAWLHVGLKFRINYRLIIVRCRSTKLQFFLVVCIFFFVIRCLKFWRPDSCSRTDQQAVANLVHVEAAPTERCFHLKTRVKPNHGENCYRTFPTLKYEQSYLSSKRI